MELQIKRGARLDDLPTAENLLLITVKGPNGEQGFQQDELSKSLLRQIVVGAYYLSAGEATTVDEDNLAPVMNRLTKAKYGILAHGGETALQVVQELKAYLSKRKIFDLKREKGMDAAPPEVPSIYTELFEGASLQQLTERMLKTCDYLSIWPKYWGEFG